MRFLGHASFEITEGSARVLIDPFLAPDNPAAVVGPDEVEPTHILLTHGHGDHVTHAVEVAKRTGAKCVALVELARWLSDQGVDDVADPNLGGTVELEWGWVKLVPAFHTCLLYTSDAADDLLCVDLGGRRIIKKKKKKKHKTTKKQ